ncbi:hypothetical protein [Bdellovibrio svalbardensis]|uniref:Lipoprotein n=1 Tax=Bdellovibrio svalbardensis TaxID=2972972 RepID=A0ABT6DJD8_9BACT|nr:hypothetical protein [Bdellovibrio svalbardensis]MDG0816974.1 hypothetical protein [Bdellovibrio svalbardensis]
MSRLILLLSLFSLVSCATKPAEQRPPPDIVGLVSLFDDQLPISSEANSKGKERTISTTSWALNDVFINEYDNQLREQYRNGLRINLDAKTVSDLKTEARNLKDIYLGDRWQILTQYVLSEASKQGAKYLIIVHPVANNTYKQYKAGYGIHCVNSPSKESESMAYFLMRSELWNVATKKIEATSTLTPDQLAVPVLKSCAAFNKMKSEKISEEFKPLFQELVSRGTDLNLQGLGIKNSLQ